MPQGPLTVFQFRPSGNSSALNLTAATLIKASPGTICRMLVNAPGSTGGAFVINDANALVAAQTITAITAAASAVVTISTGGSANPFAVGNSIAFTSVGGMTQINSVQGVVTAIGGVTTAWTITTNINSSAFTAYTSAGTAASSGAANLIWEIAYNATANVEGLSLALEFPCQNGILLSAVPTGGSPIVSASFN